jgi:hypothetical protein
MAYWRAGDLNLDERIALAEAMAAVAGALPQPHADEAVRRLAAPALTSIGQLAHAKVRRFGSGDSARRCRRAVRWVSQSTKGKREGLLFLLGI